MWGLHVRRWLCLFRFLLCCWWGIVSPACALIGCFFPLVLLLWAFYSSFRRWLTEPTCQYELRGDRWIWWWDGEGWVWKRCVFLIRFFSFLSFVFFWMLVLQEHAHGYESSRRSAGLPTSCVSGDAAKIFGKREWKVKSSVYAIRSFAFGLISILFFRHFCLGCNTQAPKQLTFGDFDWDAYALCIHRLLKLWFQIRIFSCCPRLQ